MRVFSEGDGATGAELSVGGPLDGTIGALDLHAPAACKTTRSESAPESARFLRMAPRDATRTPPSGV